MTYGAASFFGVPGWRLALAWLAFATARIPGLVPPLRGLYAPLTHRARAAYAHPWMIG